MKAHTRDLLIAAIKSAKYQQAAELRLRDPRQEPYFQLQSLFHTTNKWDFLLLSIFDIFQWKLHHWNRLSEALLLSYSKVILETKKNDVLFWPVK